MRNLVLLAALLILPGLVFNGLAQAEDLLPADRPLEEVIDHYVGARLQQENVQPAPLAEDANLARRLTLDLAGRIPTVAEVQAYLASEDSHKRTALVDRLMALPDFELHQRNELELLLMPRSGNEFRDYLLQAIKENRPWDQMFRDMIAASYAESAPKGAAQFMELRAKDADQMTNEVSTLFFGVNVSCAKCHDHPLVSDWTQDHFYGMQSFFNRTFLNGDFIGERDYGLVSFKTTAGESRQAKLMFLSGAVIDEPEVKEKSDKEKKEENEQLKELAKKKEPPPRPEYSRREQLADVALREGDNQFFARSIVNRLWYRLLGHGLVMPVDQMHSENPPSHPQLMQWLARDLVAHDYDLRRLIRGIVLSDTYARGSRWQAGERPARSLFAVALARPLTPRQYALSLKFAASNPATFPAEVKPEDWAKKIQALEGSAGGFASLIEAPHEDYQVSVDEALLFSNSDRVMREFLAAGGGTLLGHLKTIEEPAAAVDAAYWSILNRAPGEEERKLLAEYLEQRKDRPLDARGQLMWILLAGAEMRFNY